MNAPFGTRSLVLSASLLLALLSAAILAGEQKDVFRQVAESLEVPFSALAKPARRLSLTFVSWYNASVVDRPK